MRGERDAAHSRADGAERELRRLRERIERAAEANERAAAEAAQQWTDSPAERQYGQTGRVLRALLVGEHDATKREE